MVSKLSGLNATHWETGKGKGSAEPKSGYLFYDGIFLPSRNRCLGNIRRNNRFRPDFCFYMQTYCKIIGYIVSSLNGWGEAIRLFLRVIVSFSHFLFLPGLHGGGASVAAVPAMLGQHPASHAMTFRYFVRKGKR